MSERTKRQATDLPWPAPWVAQKATSGLAWTILPAVIAVGLAVVGVSQLLAHPFEPGAIVLVALIPLAAGLSLISAVTRLRLRSRSTTAVRSRAGALSVPMPQSMWVGFWLIVIGDVGWSAAALTVSRLAGIVLLVLTLPVVGLAVDRLRGKVVRGELLLSAQGIRYRNPTYDVELGWAAVERVSPAGGDGQRIAITAADSTPPSVRGRSWLARPNKAVLAQAAEATMVVRAGSLCVNPALTCQTLRYYHEHPEARAELGTDAAVQRLRAAAVV